MELLLLRLADAAASVLRAPLPDGADPAVEIDRVGSAGDRYGSPRTLRNCLLPGAPLERVRANALAQERRAARST